MNLSRLRITAPVMADFLWYGTWIAAAVWLIASDVARQPSLRELTSRAKAR